MDENDPGKLTQRRFGLRREGDWLDLGFRIAIHIPHLRILSEVVQGWNRADLANIIYRGKESIWNSISVAGTPPALTLLI